VRGKDKSNLLILYGSYDQDFKLLFTWAASARQLSSSTSAIGIKISMKSNASVNLKLPSGRTDLFQL
jgi:hypothetical protein